MRSGASAALVFGGVLALAAGVGYVLYQLGKETPDVDSSGVPRPKTAKSDSGRKKAWLDDAPPPGGPKPIKPPEPGREDVRFIVPGHEDLKMRRWREIAKIALEMQEMNMENRRLGPPNPMLREDQARFAKMNEITNRHRQYLIDAPDGWGIPPADRDPDKPPPPIMPLTSVWHPAFVANLTAVLLDRADAPLTDDQSKRLFDVAKKHSAIIDSPLPELPKDAFALEQTAEIGKRSDDFYADVFSVLTTKQAEIVSPAAYRGHAGLDIIGSGAIWSNVLRGVPCADVDEFVNEVTRSLSFSFNIQERGADIRPIVDKWAHRISMSAGDVTELEGAVRVERGQRAVQDMLDLLRHLKAELDPPPPDMERVRLVPVAFVPLLK